MIRQFEARLERATSDPAMHVFAILCFGLLAFHDQDVPFLRGVEVGVSKPATAISIQYSFSVVLMSSVGHVSIA